MVALGGRLDEGRVDVDLLAAQPQAGEQALTDGARQMLGRWAEAGADPAQRLWYLLAAWKVRELEDKLPPKQDADEHRKELVDRTLAEIMDRVANRDDPVRARALYMHLLALYGQYFSFDEFFKPAFTTFPLNWIGWSALVWLGLGVAVTLYMRSARPEATATTSSSPRFVSSACSPFARKPIVRTWASAGAKGRPL